jgi:hypothetical protein
LKRILALNVFPYLPSCFINDSPEVIVVSKCIDLVIQQTNRDLPGYALSWRFDVARMTSIEPGSLESVVGGKTAPSDLARKLIRKSLQRTVAVNQTGAEST